VAAGLLRGDRRRDLARTLGVSEETVKTHVEGVYRKLGVHSRRAAVAALAPSRGHER